MAAFASDPGVHAGRMSGQQRVYVDANMPAGLVGFMRTDPSWDALRTLHVDWPSEGGQS